MEVELMCARLAVQIKTVSGQGRDQLTSRQTAQVRLGKDSSRAMPPHGNVLRLAHQLVVAVRTPVTGRPPYRSGRTLAHTTPTSVPLLFQAGTYRLTAMSLECCRVCATS